MLFSLLRLLARAAAVACVLASAGCSFGPQPCGGPGESCCPSGVRCRSGTSCVQNWFTSTCESCGSAHRACCSSGTPCTSGFACVSTGFGSSTCEACGDANEPCCGTSCSSGLACRAGNCVSCGASGQPCCSGSICRDGVACTDTGTCGACGAEGQSCCAGSRCTSPARCIATRAGGMCTVCGGPGQPCCGGTGCDGVSTYCDEGTCQHCGALREACCAGDSCPTSGTCIAGACATPIPADASVPPASCTDVSCDFGGMLCVPFPAAICTQHCTRDHDCGPSGVCFEGTCAPNCTPGSADCDRYGGVCLTTIAPHPLLSSGVSSLHACVPSCFAEGETRPSGYPGCATGTTCDPVSGTCTTSGPIAITLGAPCTGPSDCGGACIGPTTEAGALTGFVGGYCATYGRNPGRAAFVPGVALPSSNCPPGGVAVPWPDAGDGDAVYCYAACTADCDCRVGYRCDHDPTNVGAPAPNGACLPIDCGAPDAMCPAGSTCNTFAWSTYLRYPVCEVTRGATVPTDRNAGCTGSDAGTTTDASIDAAFDATVGD